MYSKKRLIPALIASLALLALPSVSTAQKRITKSDSLRQTAASRAAPSLRSVESSGRTTATRTKRDTWGDFAIADASEHPPLSDGTDILEWYRDRMVKNEPAGVADAGEPALAAPFFTLNTTALYGSHAAPFQLQASGPSFSMEAFEQEIRDRVDGEVAGAVYALNLNGNFARGDGIGFARNSGDGFRSQSAFKRMNIASISKTLTAVAVLRLLEENGLSVDSPIAPWLPEQWQLGLGFYDDGSQSTLTFRDLLTHRSGVAQSIPFFEEFDPNYAGKNYHFDGLKDLVEYGVLASQQGNYSYANANYALFRVMIPALWAAAGGIPADSELTASDASAIYQAYMAVELFIPIGIHQATCDNSDEENRTLYYSAHEPNEAGTETGNWNGFCGSGGWYLSAYYLANVMAHMRYDDDYLSPAMRGQMDELLMGWSENWSHDGAHGLYRAHAGALYLDERPAGERTEMQGCMMKFPIEVEATLMMNSSVIDEKNPCRILGQAFDAAWVN